MFQYLVFWSLFVLPFFCFFFGPKNSSFSLVLRCSILLFVTRSSKPRLYIYTRARLRLEDSRRLGDKERKSRHRVFFGVRVLFVDGFL